MSTLSFPTSPTLNQTYTFGNKTWVWNGTAWQLQVSGAINNLPIGNSIPSTGAFTNLSGASITGGNVSIVGNVVAGNVQGGNVVLSGNTIDGAATLTLTSPNVVISGNLQVQGNTTFVSANTITTGSLDIILANSAPTASAANSAGILVGNTYGTFASILYNNPGNVWTTSLGISVNGNVTANHFNGNAVGLTSIPGANVTGQVANALIAGTVYTNAQPNITSVGTLTSLTSTGVISTSGNIYGGGINSTSSPTPPSNPSVGDFWYNTTTNAQYRYTFDGTDYFWLDDYGSTQGTDGTFSQVINGTSNVSIYTSNGNVSVGVNGTDNIAIFSTTGAYVSGLNITSSNPPATSTSPGVTGQIEWSAGYIYVCTATNTWVRAALSTW